MKKMSMIKHWAMLSGLLLAVSSNGAYAQDDRDREERGRDFRDERDCFPSPLRDDDINCRRRCDELGCPRWDCDHDRDLERDHDRYRPVPHPYPDDPWDGHGRRPDEWDHGRRAQEM